MQQRGADGGEGLGEAQRGALRRYNVSDKPSDAKGFYKKYGWTFASIDDPKRERQFKLGLPGQPSTIFVNAAGNVVGKVIGAASEQQYEQGIAAAKKR